MTAAENLFELISLDKEIVIDACDGSQTLADATTLFVATDSVVKKCRFNKIRPTGPTSVDIYKIPEKGSLAGASIIDYFENDLDKLCLTQNQIRSFCEKSAAKWIKGDKFEFFFLFKIGGRIHAAHVATYTSGLRVFAYSMDFVIAWFDRGNRGLVVPKLL
ncbi:MAG: hypothetical protein JWM20_984 [Patescibacteria group bacterium]|nr:hypothetical protein [Patescibacteria group bacterium]